MYTKAIFFARELRGKVVSCVRCPRVFAVYTAQSNNGSSPPPSTTTTTTTTAERGARGGRGGRGGVDKKSFCIVEED